MPWLDNLFGDSLETLIAQEFAVYKKSIDEMIERENAALLSLGIKPPRLISEMGYDFTNEKGRERKWLSVELKPMQFEIPPHRIFAISRDELVATLFENLEMADYVYWWWGLADVIKTEYGVVWTNRDPFVVYWLLG